jgi:hypothetical protein
MSGKLSCNNEAHMATELYEKIIGIVAESECSVAEVTGVLEMVKLELLNAAFEHSDDEEGE